ncbi:aminotransferase class III-fold pyridoxal phosphate-dependent enzyme [Yinghuangia sp. YIM S10712]|uniref:aminotransferase class III-fold pyridoxal phosphate-dependent enzyme n=1 Tax=Yinghuangia sp. YIM S10712 TaxID=3436930 RepID=UPI003F52EB8A
MTAAPTGTDTVGAGTGTGSAGILMRQARREPAARIHARSLPIVPVRARGMTVDGADGRRYLDCLSGAGTLVLGHSHPVVLEAIRAVLDAEAPLHVPDLATPIKDRFVETLFDTLPPEFARDARILFCGPAEAEGVVAAISLARSATGRQGVWMTAGACHSAGPAAGALGAVTRLPYPRAPRSAPDAGDENRPHAARRAEELLADAAERAALPAAIVLEAVRGDGEVVPAPESWLREMRCIADRHGIPLVADETQTGLARTGAFWAVEHSGILPDAVVISKAAGGSLPLAAVVYRGDADPWAPGAHAGAFRGNQLAMAAGTATIAHIRENRLDEHAARIGALLLEGLRHLRADHGMLGDVRGRGLMIGIEIVDPDTGPQPDGARSPAAPAPALASAVRAEALDRGLIVGLGGRHGTVIRLLPPLTITEEQAEAVLARLSDAVAAAGRRRTKPVDAQES